MTNMKTLKVARYGGTSKEYSGEEISGIIDDEGRVRFFVKSDGKTTVVVFNTNEWVYYEMGE